MRRLLKLLLILLPLLAVLLGALVALRRSRPALEQVRRVLQARITASLGRKVTIGKVTGDPLRRLILHRLVVAGKAGEPPLAVVDRATASYRLGQLLQGGPGAIGALRQVDLVGARAYLIRDRRGVWNFSDLLKAAKAARFTGLVTISRSSVLLADYRVPQVLPSPQLNLLRDIQATANYQSAPLVSLRFSALGPPGRVGSLSLQGTFNQQAQTLLASVGIHGAGLDYAWRYLSNPLGMAVHGGQAELQAIVLASGLGGKQPRFDYVCQADFQAQQLELPGRSEALIASRGSVRASNQAVVVNRLEGRMEGARVAARGVMAGLDDPSLDLDLQVTGASPALLRRLAPANLWPASLRLTGPLTASARMLGGWKSPGVEGQLTIASAVASGVPLKQVVADFHYFDRTAELTSASALSEGGRVNGQGWISLTGQALAGLVGDFSGIVPPANAGITGRAGGRMAVVYQGGAAQAIGNVQLTSGQIGKIPYRTMAAQVSLSGGKLVVANSSLRSTLGDFGFWGTVQPGGAIQGQAFGTQVDLAEVGRVLNLPGTAGTGYLLTQVSGTTAQPAFAGEMEAFDGSFRGVPFDLLTAEAQGSAARVVLSDVTIMRAGGEYRAHGELRDLNLARGAGTVNLQVEISQAQLDELARAARSKVKLAGLAAGRLRLSGPFIHPTVTAELTLTRPGIGGYRLDRADLALSYRRGALTLEHFTAISGNSVIVASGEISPRRQVNLSFSAENFELADLRTTQLDGRRLAVSGPVSVEGKIIGTTAHPAVEARARSPGVRVYGWAFDQVQAVLRASDDLVQFKPLAFHFGQGEVSTQGEINLVNRAINLSTTAQRVPVAPLRGLAADLLNRADMTNLSRRLIELPGPVGGELSASATMSGPWSALSGRASLDLQNAQLAGHSLPATRAELTYAWPVLQIESLEATQGPAVAKAHGRVDLTGKIALDLEAHNLEAGLFDPWIPIPSQLGGSADLDAVFSGPTRNPTVIGSLEVAQPRLGAARFDAFRIARFTIADSRLSFDESLLTADSRSIQGHGWLPFQWHTPVFPDDQPLSLAVDLPAQDLSLLTRLWPSPIPASGTMEGRFVLSGTLRRPQREGLLLISGGKLVIPQNPVTDLQLNLALAGEGLQVNQLTGKMGGGSFQVQGSIPRLDHLAHLEQNTFDLSVAANQLGIKVGRFFDAVLEGRLKISNPTPSAPAMISGRIEITKGTVGAPPTSFALQLVPIPFNPGLDIQVQVATGKTIRLRTAVVDMALAGGGRVGDALDRPVVNLDLVARRGGTITLPTGRARITQGTVEVRTTEQLAEAPGQPGRLEYRALVDMDAQTTLMVQGVSHRIDFSVSGPVTDLKLTARAEPPLPEGQIQTMLLGSEAASELQTGRPPAEVLGKRVFGLGLETAVLPPIEFELARELGLQEVGFEFGLAQPTRVRIGRYLVPGLYLSLLTTVAGRRDWLFRASYDVAPRFSVGISTNAQKETRFETSYSHRF